MEGFATGRLRAGAWLVALAFAGGAPAARGQDGPPADSAALGRAASVATARRIADLAKWCHQREYATLSRLAWAEVMELDPDESHARDVFGFRKRDGRWEADPKGQPKTKEDAPFKNAAAVDEFLRMERKFRSDAAVLMATHAAWCEDKGLSNEARDAWTVANRVDPGNEAARKALGLGGAPNEWLRSPSRGPAEAWKRFKEVAKGGDEDCPRPPREGEARKAWEQNGPPWELFGGRFKVRVYKRSYDADYAMLGVWRAGAFLDSLALIPKERSESIRYTLIAVDTLAKYRELLTEHSSSDAAWKRSSRTAGGFQWDAERYVALTEDALTAPVAGAHGLAHRYASEFADGKPGVVWLREGLAHVASFACMGHNRHSCVPGHGAELGRDFKGLDWDEVLRARIRGDEDLELVRLIGLPLEGFATDDLAKCRNFTAWLLAVSPDSLRKFVSGLGGGATADDAARAAFGCPLEIVNRRWRVWTLLP